ncbi:type II toxin-antitoxin system RelE/ParE family toxin [Sediminivirga luteola]
MTDWSIAHSTEVASWLKTLRSEDASHAMKVLDQLANLGGALGMPRSRNLGGSLYELRFRCEHVDRRITYTLRPERRIITLTTFRKQRRNERAEIARARLMLRRTP